MIVLYFGALILLTIFSFGFVDANFDLKILPVAFDFVHKHRPFATVVYVAIILLLFYFYFWLLRGVRERKMDVRMVWKIIFLTCFVLFFSFPAFSYDIFNYVATAKVMYLYRENPYIVMPIEIRNEPMLSFLHASNKTALYGPMWIATTSIPHYLGFGNVFVSIYSFKALMVVFYLLLARTIWYLSEKKLESLVFFVLNPLVIIETLVSAHNDVVMMFFAIAAFMMAKRQRFAVGFILLLFSILTKFATLVLLPLFVILWWQSRRSLKTDWTRIWRWAAYLLFVVFLLSPMREELYSWYFIWPLTFLALISRKGILEWTSYGLSLGMLLRFAPFIYAGEWGRWVPLAKKIVTATPPLVAAFFYGLKKKG